MPSNYEKLDRPSGPSLDTSVPMSPPDKAALSNVTTVCPSPLDGSPRVSASYTPRTQKLNPFDTDIEAMVPAATTDTCNNMNKVHPAVSKSECQVWPGKEHWKQKAKLAKKQRGCCSPMAQLSRRNRIIVKILMVVLVVGIAVGVGFGVSKPLHAPIWGDKSK
ncbi:hypothetical protein EDB81DRAFT_78794 [Dactylonectria macrodidyma]|uniref:Uncharacterized protein n=1 Tax=Dactylonectria macrodidyma TaxID=307937 RepID=A0A9P9IUX9_9HYPO|nr:hypothetical protein EDB81DRAFT_78794 [Dactylonectria macrodidyma]